MDYSTPADNFVRTIDVHELLPQQEPFVMIGTLEHFDMQRTVTSLRVGESNIFVQNDQMLASGLVENMAQTCAARIGYINRYIRKCGIDIGVIGSIDQLRISATPHVGDTIYTQVTVLQDVFGITQVQAAVTCHDQVIASARLKTVITNSSTARP